MRYGAVDDGGPEEDKDHGRSNSPTFSSGSNGDGGYECGEHVLVEVVEDGGNLVACLRDGLLHHPSKDGVFEVSDELSSRVAERQAVPDEVPLHTDDGEGEHGHEEQTEGVLPANESVARGSVFSSRPLSFARKGTDPL